MKRILFVTRDISYVGGTEEFIKNLLLFLAKNRNLKPFLVEIEGHGKFENTSIYSTLKRNNIRLISFRGDTEDIASVEKVKKLIEIIRKYKIDIVHSFLFNSDFLCCIAKMGPQKMWQSLNKIASIDNFCKIIPSIRMLATSKIKPVSFFWVSSKTIDVSVALEKNTLKWRIRKKIIDNEIEPIVSKNCDIVLPVFKKGVRKWNKFSRKTKLIPCVSINFKDIQNLNTKLLIRNKLRIKYGLSQDTKAFVSVARLAPEKGLDKTIDLFKNEKDLDKNILLIAGSGPLEKELKHKADGSKNIHFLGRLNRDDIFNLLVAGDIFVLLSRSEGFPLAIQEAMAAEKPIWATNVGGISDLVLKNNGVLCKVDDDQSIKATFEWFKKQNSPTLQLMGKMSKSKIVNSFVLEKIINKLTKIYFGEI